MQKVQKCTWKNAINFHPSAHMHWNTCHLSALFEEERKREWEKKEEEKKKGEKEKSEVARTSTRDLQLSSLVFFSLATEEHLTTRQIGDWVQGIPITDSVAEQTSMLGKGEWSKDPRDSMNKNSLN